MSGMSPKLQKTRNMLKGETLSNSSSRSASRARTPTADGEENGQLDFNFQSIEELLSKKLESLQSFVEQQDSSGRTGYQGVEHGDQKQKSTEQLNTSVIKSSSTGINDIIFSLSRSRTEVSSQSRELLLAQLYKLVVSKPLSIYNETVIGTNKYVTEDKVQDLVNVFTSGDYRSETEFLLLFRSIVAIIAGNIEEFSSFISSELLSHIQKLIQDPPNGVITNENKSNLITGYTGLLLVLYNGTSSFGIDEKITWLLELSEGLSLSSIALHQQIDAGDRDYSTIFEKDSDQKLLTESFAKADAEASVAISGLHATGCLLTLLKRGEYLNERITEIIPNLVDLMDNDENLEISKAAGRVIALCYELFKYDDLEDIDDEFEDEDFNSNAPYYEQGALFSIVDRLANLSDKKISKKDRKSSHSIFGDILNTLKCYTDNSKRAEIYKKSPEGISIQKSLMDYTYVKLSKTRLIHINSWFLYIRLIHLKWCFSFGLHNQLVGNETIRDILREPPTDYQIKYGYTPDTDSIDIDDNLSPGRGGEKHASSDKRRTEKIRKARVNKLAEEVEDLNIRN
ncbi:uncharacterized protein PRCAT00002267001 [Priceomyces carsonii]|uniref:uncharacterized protein n=1 Tax=Priceomyces carsonii TaxID=28549 RepID=UPI002ED9802D|nr:unnamed protein product [Priceomyces carsonii]